MVWCWNMGRFVVVGLLSTSCWRGLYVSAVFRHLQSIWSWIQNCSFVRAGRVTSPVPVIIMYVQAVSRPLFHSSLCTCRPCHVPCSSHHYVRAGRVTSPVPVIIMYVQAVSRLLFQSSSCTCRLCHVSCSSHHYVRAGRVTSSVPVIIMKLIQTDYATVSMYNMISLSSLLSGAN